MQNNNENTIDRESEQKKRQNNSGMPLEAKELKERISFAAVLKADGVRVIRNGKLIECRCPNPKHHDDTPSFKIFNDNRAYCFGCSWKGDVIEYVRMRDGSDFTSACSWLEENLEALSRNTPYEPDQRETREVSAPKPLTEAEKVRCATAASRLLNDGDKCAAVGDVRGWSQETIQSLAEAGDLGWHSEQLAFVYEAGMKVRDWPGRDFRWNCGSPSLWRGHRVEDPDTVFVTEGETDAISLIDAGVECCGGIVVSIPSSTTTRAEWFQTWIGKKVFLCFDNDDAGASATKKVIKALNGITERISVLTFDPNDSANDVAEAYQWMTGEEFWEWFTSSLKPLTTEPPPPQPPPAATPENEMQSLETDKLPSIYYSLGTKEYFLKNDYGTWIPINENSVKRHLKARGHRHGKEDAGMATPLEQCLNQIQLKHCIAYAAPLAGHDAGFYRINGQQVLVTNSPTRIEAVPGEFPVLSELLKRMFLTEAKDQRPYLFGWLKIQVEALRDKRWSYGQALAMCGPVNCGKSLIQRLITQMFGGRSAKPYQFMKGETTFNADLFEAEHLMIEDEAESTQHAQRKAFGASIKGFVANMDQRCHGKKEKGLVLYPYWRVTISVNDEPQRLLVLPPIDQDTEDKIMLLKVNAAEMPMPQETSADRERFWHTLINELSAFVDFLLKWEIPQELRHSRWGIRHYHHPDILAAVDEVSDEIRLLNLIDEQLPFYEGKPWVVLR